MKHFIISFIIVLFAISCDSERTTIPKNYHVVVVKENIEADKYSYLFVSEDNIDYWIASASIEANVGDTLFYSQSMDMNDFESKSLNRKFRKIKFISDISKKIPQNEVDIAQQPKTSNLKHEDIHIDPIEGSLTIKDIYRSKNNIENSIVLVIGKVVKINRNILDKNWIHIQDGTSWKNKYDLIITCQEEVNIGEIITIKGRVVLDQDFGHGYMFELLIEEAEVVK